ncbi:BnaCnng60070D [Brassica napus]|uniref:BnaCnng60070D protein n=1 Tax=Brassica napus TaxID=3708 RepID=A0A078JPG4_BRANA|nr:BnaCnng60070D [Brassica napus]
MKKKLEASTAKYIVQQYVAACGGPAALNAVKSMYAVGQVRMQGSGMVAGEDEGITATPVRLGKGNFEVGGFVLWQKNPNLWFLELVVSGFKISAGSDGKVAWNQSSTQPSQAHRGPPRPLRRFFQGLDPRCTASLFLDAACIGEQTINGEDCFVLKVETPADILKAQCSANTEVIHHTVWGYFSQRTGLLVKFGDTKLVRVRSARGKNDGVFWETSMESIIDDYMYVDSVNIAHSGRTLTTLYRYGGAVNHRRRIEEKWRIEEVDFNICGLCLESFLPPSDMNNDH